MSWLRHHAIGRLADHSASVPVKRNRNVEASHTGQPHGQLPAIVVRYATGAAAGRLAVRPSSSPPHPSRASGDHVVSRAGVAHPAYGVDQPGLLS